MKRIALLLLVLAVCIPALATCGLSLELGYNTGDYRVAVAGFGNNSSSEVKFLGMILSETTSYGGELGTMDGDLFAGGFRETGWTVLVAGDTGMRGALRNGACYLFGEERPAYLSGCSISAFWRRYNLIATYTAASYVMDKTYRSTWEWYFGMAISLYLP